jgi:uncharacterized protein YdhG (YjbR/CyaY superfamily)
MMHGAPIPPDIDAYIADCPREVQAKMQQLRTTIQKAAPEATEAISYSMPAFKFHGPLVYFATFKRHIGFYAGSYALRHFAKELAGYEKATGTIRFYFEQAIPFGLITRIVKLRVKENLAKVAARAKKKAARKRG